MGDKAAQLERHIDQQRNALRDNLVELEARAKRVVDWRSQVEQRPMLMIGLAFGGGVLLSALIGGTSRPSVPRRPRQDSGGRPQDRAESATWAHLKGALLGVAAAKLGTVVEQLLPGFHEEYKKAEAGATTL